MFGRVRGIEVVVMVGLLTVGALPLRAQSPDVAAEQARTDAILLKLLATPGAQHRALHYSSWPPTATVVESSQLGAFSDAQDCQPAINLSSALIVQVIGDDDGRLAFVLGHELSHILLGHTECTIAADTGSRVHLGHLAYSRDQEYAADKSGLALALAAGYPYDHCFSLFKALQKVAPSAPLDALAEDHPSTTDRSAQLETDATQQMLWRNMGAFADGVSLLVSQQYGLAVTAFQGVTHQFPKAWDAWNNQGYALLMLYADKLRPDDIAQMHLGEVATGGFYRQAASLSAQLRGKNFDQWSQAVAALQYAAQLQPQSELIQGNLGLAYAMAPKNPDEAPDVAQAPAFLKQALAQAHGSSEATARDNINLAVADERLNQPAAARLALAAAQAACGAGGSDDDVCASLRPALLFDAWLTGEGAQGKPDLDRLAQYLSEEPHDSAWWQTGFAAYQGLAQLLHVTAQPASDFPQSSSFRRISAVAVGSAQVEIGEDWQTAMAALGQGTLLPATPDSPLQRVCYPAHGLDLIGGNRVVAIVLYGIHAPALSLQHSGLTAAAGDVLTIGESQGPLLPLLGPDPAAVTADGDGLPFRLLAQSGVAVALDAKGTLQQVMVMAEPDDSATGMN